MLQLQNLKEIGCVSVELEEVDYHGDNVVSITETSFWSKSKKSRFQGVLIIDNTVWAATVKKIPITKASKVYSSDGEMLCVWDSQKRTAFIKKLNGNKLETVQQILMPKKEEKQMAQFDLNDMDLNLDGVGAVAPQETPGATKESELSKANREFIEKMSSQDIALANNSGIINRNRKYGKALGFITRTDKAIRLVVSKVIKNDANGNGILSPSAPEEIKAQYKDYLDKKEGVKRPAMKYFETESEIKFRQAKPGKIVGMIIATPAITDKYDMNDIMSHDIMVDANADASVLTTKVLPIEYAYIYLINAYDGVIQEDKELLGSKASLLEVRGVVDLKKKTESNGKDIGIRYSIRLASSSDERKSLLVDENYIPAKVYKTLSQNEITDAAASEALNNNVLALFKDPSRLNTLTANSKALLTNGNKGIKYFSLGADKTPIGQITSFDGVSFVTDAQIAVRDKKLSKDGTKTTYPFVFEDGYDKVFAKPTVARIMKKAGLSEEELGKKITELCKSKSTSTKKSTSVNALSIEALKKYNATEKKTINDLNKILAGIA